MVDDNNLVEAEKVVDEEGSTNNNSNLGNIANLLKDIDINQVLSLLNSVDISQLSSLFGAASSNNTGTNLQKKRSKEIEVLNAIKPMVSSQRGELIDIILQIYSISRILK